MNRHRSLSQPIWQMLPWLLLSAAVIVLSVAASSEIWPSAQI